MAHVVTAPLVIVRDKTGADQYLYQGAEVPEYVEKDRLKALVGEKLVEEVKPARSSRSSRSTPDPDDDGKTPPAGADGESKGTAPTTGKG